MLCTMKINYNHKDMDESYRYNVEEKRLKIYISFIKMSKSCTFNLQCYLALFLILGVNNNWEETF